MSEDLLLLVLSLLLAPSLIRVLVTGADKVFKTTEIAPVLRSDSLLPPWTTKTHYFQFEVISYLSHLQRAGINIGVLIAFGFLTNITTGGSAGLRGSKPESISEVWSLLKKAIPWPMALEVCA